MPQFSTSAMSFPSLLYFAYDDRDEIQPFNNVEKAVAVAAVRAFHTGQTASVYVYVRSEVRHRLPGRLPNGDPTSVMYVKVTVAS